VEAILMNLPSLEQLALMLGIQSVNSGKTSFVGGPSGLVTDDIEGLHAVLDHEGRVVVRSGVEMSPWVFRGQTRFYRNCVPTLARMQSLEEQYLSLCRNAAFEEALLSHPYVQICCSARWMDQPLSIDCNGLAQHYGLATTLLDTSNSFEVASFFATCELQSNGDWLPVIEAEDPGVIYQLFPYSYVNPGTRPLYREVGWQPLHRPAQQKASTIDLGFGQSLEKLFGVKAYLFRHDARISMEIWQKSQEGMRYFPPDPAEDLAQKAKVLMRFTTETSLPSSNISASRTAG
jgi:hypothetical protein